MKDIDRIQSKIIDIQNQINSIKLSEIVENRVGGNTIVRTGQLNKDFQYKRIEILQWALNATEEDILSRINQMETEIPELPFIMFNYIGNDFKTLETISIYELLKLSIKEG